MNRESGGFPVLRASCESRIRRFIPEVRMRISTLCLAILALFTASGAHALNVSLDGAGDAVLLPYYALVDGQTAVFSITNHAVQPSVVRVVVAEGTNGRAALTFNVYLAGNDSWSGALVAPAEPGPLSAPLLVTNDASCTSAPIGQGGIPLRKDAYTGSRDDGLGDSAIRLYTGQMEVIEVGRPTGSAAALVQAGDCDALRARFGAGGTWSTDPNTDVAAPGGRISAEMQVVDVEAGVAFGIDPLTLQGFSSGPRHGPGDVDFQVIRIYKPTARNAQGHFDVGGAIMDGERPADAVSLLIMSADLEGAFSVEESLDARTQWAIAFPTRPAYLDNRPGGEFVGESRPPFHYLDMLEPECPIETTWQAIDRAGAPGGPKELVMCAQVNRVDILRGEGPDADVADIEFHTGDMERGRIRVGFHPERHLLVHTVGPVLNNATLGGLPVIAVPMIEVRNANAQPGILASYAITGTVVRRRGDSSVDF